MKIWTWLVALVLFLVVITGFVLLRPWEDNPTEPTVENTDLAPTVEDSGLGILICHQNKQGLLPNFSANRNANFPLIESVAIALRGINGAIKSELSAEQIVNSVSVVSTFTLPGFAGGQLVNATCSTVDKSGVAMCEDDITSTVFGFDQNTVVSSDGSYIRTITRDGQETVIEGKKGDPGYIRITNDEGRALWQRDGAGVETLNIDYVNGNKLMATESPDCSGRLNSTLNDGTSIVSSWSSTAEANTTGQLSVSSPNPYLNFSISW